MVFIGDFTLEDKIFPGSSGDSLLYTDTEVETLWETGYQVARHRPPGNPSQPPRLVGDGTNSTHVSKESSKATVSLDKKCTKCSPPTNVRQESEDKDRSGSKYRKANTKRTRRIVNLHASILDLQHGDPPPCGARWSPTWRILPRLSRPPS